MTARDELARRQEELVRALVAGGPVPAGLDPSAVAATGEVCRRKRRHVVGRSWWSRLRRKRH